MSPPRIKNILPKSNDWSPNPQQIVDRWVNISLLHDHVSLGLVLCERFSRAKTKSIGTAKQPEYYDTQDE